MVDHNSAPRVGDVLVLPESEYRYGVGPVIARLHAVLEQVEYRGEIWWYVSGQVANGDPENHGGFVTRDLYVREASLSQTRRVLRA